ncbi:ribosome small subunit-dependent GTPase A [Streptomyces aidingensis]|uniref:Small ribosomal subunit biogenesis GTPase RsgA n=1 Tax=Streptomyces aidingensis TaxID=910347 RepID=A0A1I1IQS8_9ACTN|nr:ribosome small subunit-dependent GTPase A [Streptomyces aidingensis]SFC38647.1 ribosome biogenesis GTPase [Streptomyces aidingensis]
MTEHARDSHPLRPYGWDEYADDAFAPYAGQGVVPGRIVRVHRARCEVVTAHGPVHAGWRAEDAGDPTRIPCTGDWAVLDRDAGWSVRTLLPRRTAFLRSGSGTSSHGQVLAANIDLALVAVSLAEDLVPGRLERFVSLAWAGGARPAVVLTKADLAPDAPHLHAEARSLAPGAEVFTVSAFTSEGLPELAAALAGVTSVLVGVSGAGKSTLVNALTGRTGEEAQRVREVRGTDGRGRHTTTTRDLLPLPGGGVLIDTPGLRGVGLWDAGEGVHRAFADIEELAAGCRFTDCAHRTEPDCAVLAAVADGRLGERRLESYRKLLRENARLAARADARLRAGQRAGQKLRHTAMRQVMDQKYGPGHRGRRR